MPFYKGNKLGKGRKMGSKNKKTIAQLERWQKEQDRIFDAMQDKTLSKEKYDDLMTAADKAQKNIQLLSGNATERTGLIVEISEEIAKKNEISKDKKEV